MTANRAEGWRGVRPPVWLKTFKAYEAPIGKANAIRARSAEGKVQSQRPPKPAGQRRAQLGPLGELVFIRDLGIRAGGISH